MLGHTWALWSPYCKYYVIILSIRGSRGPFLKKIGEDVSVCEFEVNINHSE